MQRALALGALQRRRDLRWDERLRITQPSLATQVPPIPLALPPNTEVLHGGPTPTFLPRIPPTSVPHPTSRCGHN